LGTWLPFLPFWGVLLLILPRLSIRERLLTFPKFFLIQGKIKPLVLTKGISVLLNGGKDLLIVVLTPRKGDNFLFPYFGWEEG